MNAIITGATKGLGLAIAGKLAEAGFDLAICSRNESELESISNDLNHTYGVHVFWMKADLSLKEEADAFAVFCSGHFPSVDLLVNNAGIFIPLSILNEEEGDMEKQMNVNLFAPYYITRPIARSMQKEKKGHIFTICSIASKKVVPTAGSYSMSKYALYAFSQCLREELGDSGVRVTAILPGATYTDSWAGTTIPKDRFIDPEDIATSILNCYRMNGSGNIDEIMIRPLNGDL